MIINHVSVGASNVEKSAAFYDKVLATLGISRSHTIEGEAISYGTNFEFWVGCICGKHSISGTGTHIAFNAPTEESVKAFHAVAIENGGLCAGEPGPRPEYGDAYYAAYIHDLDGNKIEAVCT